jgi:hypothetical protein
VTNNIRVICVALAVFAVACSGGTRPELDDAVAGADAEPTATVTPDPDEPDEVATSDADVSPDDEAPTPEATADAEAAGDPTPTTGPDAAPADPSDYPLQGTVTVALADGRSYEAPVGCNYATAGDAWEFRFGGESAAGVQIEGAYDTTQPDFVILFVAGPDSLNGDDVLLSNVNGGDDLVETNSGGDGWQASITLWSPEGQSVDAQLTATCG